MTKSIENFIEGELYAYHDNLKEIELRREEIMEGSPGPPDGMPRGNSTSNPTESKAMRLMSSRSILCVEKRLEAIKKVLDRYEDNESMKRLIELRYFKREHTPFGIMKVLHISQKTFYRWRRELLEEIASELGLK